MGNKKLILAAIIVMLISLFFAFDLERFLTLESLKSSRDALTAFYQKNAFVMVGAFIAVYIIQSALFLPGAAVLSLAAGAIFGAVMGTLYVIIGATIGATLAFLITRYLFHDAVQEKYGARLTIINRELETRGFNYFLFLRLVSLFPFFLINLGAGITKIPLRTFFIGTLIGIIPGSFVFCMAGASLATVTSIREVASVRVLGSLALLGVFALAPVFYQKFKQKQGGA